MRTTTEQLIERLAQDVRPVRRVPAPAIRTMVWLTLVPVCSIVVLLAMGALNEFGRAGLDAWGTALLLATAGVGIAAAFAAFAGVVPGRSRRFITIVIGTGAAWVAVTTGAAWRDLARHGEFGLRSQSDWSCVAVMTAVSALLVAVMLRMLRRGGAPLTPGLTAMFAGLGASAFASLVACAAHPHPYSSIVLVWHGGTALLIAGFLATVGRRLLPWRRAVAL